MSLKSIATFSADWNVRTDRGNILLRRLDGGDYRVTIADPAEFDAAVAELSAGGPIFFDTKALTITVRYRIIYMTSPARPN
jgi:hypothetical protein